MRLSISLALLIASGLAAAPGDSVTLQIKKGRAAPFSGAHLNARDGVVVSATSEKVLTSQILEFSLKLPTPELPEKIGSAALALAIHGNEAHSINASVWAPKARTWRKLDNEFLPTDPKGFVLLKLMRPKSTLSGKYAEFLFRFESHEVNAKPIEVMLDAAKIVVSAPVVSVKSAHETALKADGNEPHFRVHSFQGNTSTDYESRVSSISKNFREKKPPPPKKEDKKKKKKKK